MRAGASGDFRQRTGLQQAEKLLDAGQAVQGIGQGDQVAWPGRFQRHPRQNPLRITRPAQQTAQVIVAAVVQQLPHALPPLAEGARVAQGSMQPPAQQPPAHRRHATVQDPDQRMLVPSAQALLQLQVTAAGGVHDHAVLVPLHPQAGQMRQGAALGVFDVLQETTGGGDGHRLVGTPEAFQIAHTKLRTQGATGAVWIEMPGRLPAQAGMAPPGLRRVAIFSDQQFRRLKPLQFVAQRRLSAQLHDGEPAPAQHQTGETVSSLALVQRRQQAVAALVQQRLIGQGAGRDNAHHLPLHRPFTGGGITQLLANRYRQTKFDQLGEVVFDRVKRYARHRDRFAGGLAARGQRDVEQLGGPPGVVVKQLVKISHPIKQQQIGVLGLDAQVLPHHGRMFFKSVSRWVIRFAFFSIDSHLSLLSGACQAHVKVRCTDAPQLITYQSLMSSRA